MAENIYIPERKDFLVKPVSTYLCFVMGPVANASRIFGAAGHCHFGEQGADLSMPETTAGKAPDEKCTTRPVPQRLLEGLLLKLLQAKHLSDLAKRDRWPNRPFLTLWVVMARRTTRWQREACALFWLSGISLRRSPAFCTLGY